MSDVTGYVLVGLTSFVAGLAVYACAHASRSLWGPVVETASNEKCGFFCPQLFRKKRGLLDTQIELIV